MILILIIIISITQQISPLKQTFQIHINKTFSNHNCYGFFV